MMIKTQDGEKRVAGSGTTALGIIGTVLGGAAVGGGMLGMGNNCGNGGILGGLFNSNRGGDCVATKWDLCQSERIGALESVIAGQNAKIYTDSVGTSLFERLSNVDKAQTAATNSLFRETFVALAALDKETAVNNTLINKNLELLNQKVDYAIAAERCYVDGNFVKGKLVMPLCKICPTPAVAPAVQPVPNCCE